MRLSRVTTWINSRTGTALVLAALLLLATPACKQDPIDSSIQRLRLGQFQIALITSLRDSSTIVLNGRIRAYDTRDTLYEAPGVGLVKHFVSFRDTVSSDSLRLLYTLPGNLNFRIDSTQRFTLLYRKIDSRFALLLKTKTDSLVCAFGTLLPEEWVFVLNLAGNQGFRVGPGNNLYLARNTECGREGDFDVIFSTAVGTLSVGPARGALMFSGDKVYAVFTVVNTRLIKGSGRCPNFQPEFGIMILQQ